MLRVRCAGFLACALLYPLTAGAAEIPAGAAFEGHPAAKILNIFFPGGPPVAANAGTPSSQASKKEYLAVVASNVDFYKRYQNETGAIIDPGSKREIQYATPAYAAAAAVLVKEGGRNDLLDSACKAQTFAVNALVARRAADAHMDFYTPLIMHAHEKLKGIAPPQLQSAWDAKLKEIIPEHLYRQDMRALKWNIVSSSGELMRRQAGLVAETHMPSQWRYLSDNLELNQKDFTAFGLMKYLDDSLATDAHIRFWLDNAMAAHGVSAAWAEPLQHSLVNGALTSLLLLSPSGESPSGGRSSFHTWNDAQLVLISEVHANYWNRAGRADVAGAFKRAAHLSFASVKYWQRPTGESSVVQNRADPAQRFGYESYSSESAYNLQTTAMLAMAYGYADDSIRETRCPSETGGYVLDLRDDFHKVAAAAGGYYVLIDTGADPKYNATGLQRVHRAGIMFSALSDSVAASRAYEPKDPPAFALAPGLAWNDAATKNTWQSLADFSGGTAKLSVRTVELKISETSPEKVVFELDYTLQNDAGQQHLLEQYTLSSQGVDCTTALPDALATGAYRAQFPVLVSDGAAATTISKAPGKLTVTHGGSTLTWTIEPAEASPELTGPRSVMHTGWVERGVVALKSPRLQYRITLAADR